MKVTIAGNSGINEPSFTPSHDQRILNIIDEFLEHPKNQGSRPLSSCVISLEGTLDSLQKLDRTKLSLDDQEYLDKLITTLDNWIKSLYMWSKLRDNPVLFPQNLENKDDLQKFNQYEEDLSTAQTNIDKSVDAFKQALNS